STPRAGSPAPAPAPSVARPTTAIRTSLTARTSSAPRAAPPSDPAASTAPDAAVQVTAARHALDQAVQKRDGAACRTAVARLRAADPEAPDLALATQMCELLLGHCSNALAALTPNLAGTAMECWASRQQCSEARAIAGRLAGEGIVTSADAELARWAP